MFCESCGTFIPDGQSFCSNCGTPVAAPAAAPAEAPVAAAAPAPAPAPAPAATPVATPVQPAQPVYQTPPQPVVQNTAPANNSQISDIEATLNSLRSLLESGMITQEDFEKKKAEILERL